MLAPTKPSARDLAAQLGRIRDQDGNIGYEYRDTLGGDPAYTKWVSREGRMWVEPALVRPIPWGLDNLQRLEKEQTRTLVLTQNEDDMIAVVYAGYPAALASPTGSHIGKRANETHYDWMFDNTGLRKELRADKVIIVSHANPAGLAFREEIVIRLGIECCYVVAMPGGCVTPTDILAKYGADVLKSTLDQAQPLCMDSLVEFGGFPETMARPVYKTGWRSLESNLVITTPELMVVTGTPGSGKSQWVVNLVLNLARLYGMKGALIQFEDNFERTRGDLMSYATAWRNSPNADGELAMEDPEAWLSQHVMLVPPAEEEEDIRDLAWVRRIIREAATRHGCKWVVLDPWNEIEHVWPQGSNEAAYLNGAVRELKRLARRYRICLIIVAHPDKTGGRHEGIDEMSLYSIAGGAVWKNKADHGIVIAREVGEAGYTGNTWIKVDKSKDHVTMGMPGSVLLKFDVKTRTYSSL